MPLSQNQKCFQMKYLFIQNKFPRMRLNNLIEYVRSWFATIYLKQEQLYIFWSIQTDYGPWGRTVTKDIKKVSHGCESQGIVWMELRTFSKKITWPDMEKNCKTSEILPCSFDQKLKRVIKGNQKLEYLIFVLYKKCRKKMNYYIVILNLNAEIIQIALISYIKSDNDEINIQILQQIERAQKSSQMPSNQKRRYEFNLIDYYYKRNKFNIKHRDLIINYF